VGVDQEDSSISVPDSKKTQHYGPRNAAEKQKDKAMAKEKRTQSMREVTRKS
jgi:hypothetical protein